MSIDDQREVLTFLGDPRSYPPPVDRVEQIETHSAIVFLAGAQAYKLKRAVLYDYLDFSTRERRRQACQSEFALNRRLAPDLYLGVVEITREPDGRLTFGGPGPAVDTVVRMVRFDQAALLDRMAARGLLTPALMADLGARVASAHRAAPVRTDHGGRAGMAWVVDGNADAFGQFADVLALDRCRRLTDGSREALSRHGTLLETRRLDGHVRECHGDLHLRNIVLFDGRPTLFDAVEFNERISCIDVAYDAAFLLMDLWRLELKEAANVFFNEYLSATRDLGALPLLPLFLSCRSAVRAKTSATAARLQSDARRADELRQLARTYLAAAESFLNPRPPVLIAVGGFSGSGKSTVARHLAPRVGPPPGALIVRSDLVRKSMHGVAPTDRLEEAAYTPAVSDRVYAVVGEQASTALRAGHSVLVDAVCGTSAERRTLCALADAAAVRFAGIWLEAPFDEAAERIRRRNQDASDATVDVLRAQMARDQGPVDWYRVDASGEAGAVQRRVEHLVAAQLMLG